MFVMCKQEWWVPGDVFCHLSRAVKWKDRGQRISFFARNALCSKDLSQQWQFNALAMWQSYSKTQLGLYLRKTCKRWGYIMATCKL